MARNNAMPMLMMLLLVGGAVVAFTKRCEWFKMCGDLPDLGLRDALKSVGSTVPVGPGSFPSKQVAMAPGEVPPKQVAMGPGDPRGFNWGTASKFARISYT